jgi:hypothetical protein
MGEYVTFYESERNQAQMDFFNQARIQRNPTIRKKACLVAKGYTQNQGIDKKKRRYTSSRMYIQAKSYGDIPLARQKTVVLNPT